MAELRLASDPMSILMRTVRRELGVASMYEVRSKLTMRGALRTEERHAELTALDALAQLPEEHVSQAARQLVTTEPINKITASRCLELALQLAANWIEERREFEKERLARHAADVVGPRPRLCERCGTALATICTCDEAGRHGGPKIHPSEAPTNLPSMRRDSDTRRS